MMLGTRRRAANTCASTPSPMMPATSGISSVELPATVGLHLSGRTGPPGINALTPSRSYRLVPWLSPSLLAVVERYEDAADVQSRLRPTLSLAPDVGVG